MLNRGPFLQRPPFTQDPFNGDPSITETPFHRDYPSERPLFQRPPFTQIPLGRDPFTVIPLTSLHIDFPEGTWAQVIRQEVISYRDPT